MPYFSSHSEAVPDVAASKRREGSIRQRQLLGPLSEEVDNNFLWGKFSFLLCFPLGGETVHELVYFSPIQGIHAEKEEGGETKPAIVLIASNEKKSATLLLMLRRAFFPWYCYSALKEERIPLFLMLVFFFFKNSVLLSTFTV